MRHAPVPDQRATSRATSAAVNERSGGIRIDVAGAAIGALGEMLDAAEGKDRDQKEEGDGADAALADEIGVLLAIGAVPDRRRALVAPREVTSAEKDDHGRVVWLRQPTS